MKIPNTAYWESTLASRGRENTNPSHLALQKAYDVYMVEDGYSNCYALPAEWMETIDPSYCIAKS